MKKIKSLALLLAVVLIAGTGCLKDKGFDNHEYGINDPDGSPAGVGFHKGIVYKNNVGLDLSPTSQTIEDVVIVSLFSANAAQTDVHVKIQLDPTIIANYNTANGTNIVDLSTSLFSVSGFDLVIPAGQKLAKVTITVPSTITLDANETYGIGLRIVSVDAPYIIASNADEILLSIGLKNKYDGKYSMNSVHNRPPATTYGWPMKDVEMHMITSGPADVAFFWPEADDYGHPIGVGPTTLNWYGNTLQPVITFNPTTNVITNVRNVSSGPVMRLYSGSIPTNNHYDPITKTIYVAFEYNNNPDRAWFDTLRYTGPR